MKHSIGDDRDHSSRHGQSSRASTAVFVTAEELERRQELAEEADRIRASIGPLGFSAVAIIREFRDGQPEYVSETEDA